MSDFHKFLRITKLEEDAAGKLQVFGVATWEKPDLDNEVCDYETAVPVYKAWASKALSRTTGAGQEPSWGNIRLQHSIAMGGKATRLVYDDDAREIKLLSVPLNDEIADQLRQGFFTGYSQGGRYAWRACSDCGKSLSLAQAANYCPACKKNVVVNYGLESLSEVSYVDSPCTGQGFEYVKSTGVVQMVRFATSRKVTLPYKVGDQVRVRANGREVLVTLQMIEPATATGDIVTLQGKFPGGVLDGLYRLEDISAVGTKTVKLYKPRKEMTICDVLGEESPDVTLSPTFKLYKPRKEMTLNDLLAQ
jgi:hypothetical protein